MTFSQNYACEDCGVSIEELAPRMFSFNSPFGACPTCTGLGSQMKADPALIIPNPGLSILVTVVAFNLLGDSIRDILDPGTRRSHKKRKKRKPILKAGKEPK